MWLRPMTVGCLVDRAASRDEIGHDSVWQRGCEIIDAVYLAPLQRDGDDIGGHRSTLSLIVLRARGNIRCATSLRALIVFGAVT